MSTFGTLTLLIALVVATYAGTASLVGARRRSRRLIESGRGAAYALAAVLGLSSVALVYAFVSHDFSIKYVHRYSDAASPLFYQITAYWGGLDGSILWWVFLLSVFSAIAVYTNRNNHRELMPYVVTVLMSICFFFLYVIVFHKNPFETYLTETPVTGKGLNPLLQNAYMVTHPPSLYIGFVGMSIPFAFGLAALISGQLDDAWIASVRRWTLIAWFFLSMGLTLGMLWAYEELGWGGFWGWDPVENAGFLPWLTATAFLHSVMIQERRGMMKIWNFTLIILTFFLTIFGTFMTRSGIVQSVHAFGQDSKLALLFSIFMVIILAVSFGFVIKRLPELRSRGTLESWLSREAAFLVNNWVLLFSAFFILFATMFPTLSEGLTGERITVGPPFFNKWMVPIGLVLLFLTGVGPLIAWRKATASHLRYQFAVPAAAAAIAVGICFAAGVATSVAAVICFALCAFVLGTIGQEFARGMGIRKRNTGTDAFSALLGMVIRGKRRYGGYIVHVGIVLMFFGWAGGAYQKEEEVRLEPGQSTKIGRYTLKFERLAHQEDRQKEMVTGEITVFDDKNREIARMRPAKWYFRNHENEPTTEVAIRRTPAEDLYITLGNYDLADGVGNFKLVVNPLVDWAWFGFMVMAIGTGIALLPETVLQAVAVRVPAGSAAGSAGAGGAVVLLLVLGLGLGARGGRAHAQEMRPSTTVVTPPQSPEEIWLLKNIMCQCGTCRHQLFDCGSSDNCGHGAEERAVIKQMLSEGKTRQDVIGWFFQKYKSYVFLAEPIDKGFNRLAWAFPYAAGVVGLGGLGLAAWRLHRRQSAAAAAGAGAVAGGSTGSGVGAAQNPDLEDRLDDELRRLD